MDQNIDEISRSEEFIGGTNDYYSKKDFWNERFTKTEGFFDWYVGWEELKPLISKYVQTDGNILMVGCGNSKLSEQMYKSSFKNIVNIDISDVVIQKMNDLYKVNFPEMKFMEMDATEMSFPDNSFDFVFDKGTLDALMCDKRCKAPLKLVQEMYRVTKENGHFVIITYGDPEMRLNFLSSCVNVDETVKVEINFQKIELSMLSNLINSLRNRSTDGAINTAIKDKNVLLNSLIDVYDSKLNDKDLDQVTRKKYLCMKILALTKLKKLEKQKKLEEIAKSEKSLSTNLEEEKKTEGNTQKNEESNLTSNDEKKNVNKENIEQTINNHLDKASSGENKNREEENPELNDQEERQKKRRTHCYAYIFKKLELNKN